MLNTHHYLMKKVLIVILALLLTIVWSRAAVRMSDKASRLALLPVADTICSPAAYPMGEYDLTLEVGEITTFPLEYYNLLLCSSTESTLTITLPSPPKNIYETICAGETHEWEGEKYTESGAYTKTLQNIYECDSVVTLHLEVRSPAYAEQSITSCDSYTWNGETYTTSGDYTYTTTGSNGCDSITTLHLTINKTKYAEETYTACDKYEWNGETYTTSGDYLYTTTGSNGCDSITTLHLTINNTKYAEVTHTDCDSYTWNGETYTTSGDYTYTTTASNGCDSITTLHLTILPPTQYFSTDTFLCYGEVCDWREVVYAESGVYRDTVRNILDCDSLIFTLNLTIYPEIPITHVIDTIAGTEYHWHDNTYTEGGEYMVTLSAITGCDSVVVLHLLDNHAAIDTVIMYEQCAGSGEQEIEILTQGFIDSIALRYSPLALQAGLTDTLMPLSENDLYTIQYRDVRAGAHEVTAVGLFRNEEVAQYTFALTYLYPNTIFEQRYNDLLAVLTHDYNGGYDFTAFQWYQDNMPLQGETNSYLNQQLNFNAEYSVLLTDTNGVQLMSCPFIPTNRAEISIYPTIVKPGEK